MNNIKTILLIGRTGNGKSTLANVLLGKKNESGNFDEFFGESAGSVSETKKVQIEEFEEDGVKYRIVDTVGIGDTEMTLDKVLRKLATMGYSVRDGVSQILFVTDGRMANEAKLTYDLLKKVVFDENIAQYTTVVRTNFAGFRLEERQKKEKEKMIENSENFKELIKECNEVIYVDNPPVDIDDDNLVTLYKKRREDSRKMLLDHLKTCQGNYSPQNLVKLGNEINDYMVKKKDLKRKKDEKQVSLNEKWFLDKVVWSAGEKLADMKEINDNKILNREITKKMIELIGEIDPRLRKEIQEELGQLWGNSNQKIGKGENTPFSLPRFLKRRESKSESKKKLEFETKYSESQWRQIIDNKKLSNNIQGVIEKVFPLESENRVVVINSVLNYGVHLFEYDSEDKELKKVENKMGGEKLALDEVEDLKKEISNNCRILQEKAKEKQRELKQAKNDYIVKVNDKSSFSSVKTAKISTEYLKQIDFSENYAGKLEKLLKVQEKARKYGDVDFAEAFERKKDKLVKVTSEELIGKLDKICNLNREFFELEMELESMRRIVQVFHDNKDKKINIKQVNQSFPRQDSAGSLERKKTHEEIESKNDQLKKIIDSVKDKLKSNSKLFAVKKERDKQLVEFFQTFPDTQEKIVKGLDSIKQGLGKRLNDNEIKRLCRELVQLQKEKESAERQEQQVFSIGKNEQKAQIVQQEINTNKNI